MALTAAEKQRVLDELNKLDRWSLQRILSSGYTLIEYIRTNPTLRWIGKKIAEWELHRIFDSIMDFFFNN